MGFTVMTVFCFSGISLLLACFYTFLIIELSKFFTNYINLLQCSDAAGVLSFTLPQKPLPELWADIHRGLEHGRNSGIASVTPIAFSVASCLLFARVNSCIFVLVGSKIRCLGSVSCIYLRSALFTLPRSVRLILYGFEDDTVEPRKS